jgi:hypothetical protein
VTGSSVARAFAIAPASCRSTTLCTLASIEVTSVSPPCAATPCTSSRASSPMTRPMESTGTDV